jgi:hypothetical protein
MRFPAAYASALERYIRDPGEQSLRDAYELGREAVTRQMSVLELALVHQEALNSALGDAPVASTQDVARAAGDFFLESLTSFEMVQRGVEAAREAARLERHQNEMSRQLSAFLADAALVFDASDSLEEMLQLVAEQARELVGAECCVATVAMDGQPRRAEATSYSSEDRRWTGFVRWLDLLGIYHLIRVSGGAVRMSGDQLSRSAPFDSAAVHPPVEGWLAASLTALDGGELGAVQLFDKEKGGFTEEDEAVLIHLAQMASAAVERTRLYHESG